MAIKRNYKKLLYAVLTLFLLVITIISGRGIFSAFAYTGGYTSALEDLQKDSAFNAGKYLDKAKDYSIQVIQIAESVNGELFVYTYQPCQKTTYLVATKINMSLTNKMGGRVESDNSENNADTSSGNNDNQGLGGAAGNAFGGGGGSGRSIAGLTDNDKPKFYNLTLINTSGVFGKYKVNDFTVSGDTVRYYNITSIYRDWIKSIDGESGSDNSKIEKYFEVGKLFKAETVDGKIKYSCKNVDTVEIKNPYVDFISYGQQSGWDYIFGVTNWTDIHYVAFSTDKKIETLKEADVTYTTQSYHFTGKDGKGYTYGKKSVPQYLTLTGEEEIGVDGYKQYTWKSIYRTEDFVKTTNLTGEAKTEVEKSEFVLVFLKTDFEEQEKWSMMQGHYKEADGTKVSDVSILRLMFETDGITYNLGALMDIQEGDDIAGNKPPAFDFWQWLADLLGVPVWVAKLIVYGVVALAVLGIALPILSIFFPIVGIILKSVLNAVIFVISAPFKLIAWIFRKVRGE